MNGSRYLVTIVFINLKSDLIFLQQEKEIRRFAGTVPNGSCTGDIESMVMYAGEGVGLIKEILPAAEVVRSLVEGAQLLIHEQLTAHDH